MLVRIFAISLILLTSITSLVAQDRLELEPILSSDYRVRIDIPADWDTIFFKNDALILSQSDDVLMTIYYTQALRNRAYTSNIPTELNQLYADEQGVVDKVPEIIETDTFRHTLRHEDGIIVSENFGENDILLIDVRTDDVDDILPTLLAILDTLEPYTEEFTLENYQGDWRVVTSELIAKDYISSGELIQRMPEVIFEGEDNHYKSLAKFEVLQDVAVGATIELQSGTGEIYENCGVMARVVSDDDEQVLNFLEVGIDSDGDAYIFDRYGSGENDFTLEFAPALGIGDEYYIFYKIEGPVANVFVNGQIVFENLLVRERAGHFGLAFVGNTMDSSCALKNIWTYSLASLCNVTVFEDVDTYFSPEETEIPLGEALAYEPYAANAYYLDKDLNGWWRLALDSRWVQADDSLLEGACTDIKFVETLAELN